MLAFPVGAHAILAVLRARHDETSGIAELTLAAPVSRVRWAPRRWAPPWPDPRRSCS
ncbi:hypothetical protein [Promicromonospora panici]|uniref:hypothetical protein n=1 Tax=Promicromonospora panici TaxID=2219658 RepID=UPI0013E9BCCA|nr:hypothetical protein [Promicromonospora panici]